MIIKCNVMSQTASYKIQVFFKSFIKGFIIGILIGLVARFYRNYQYDQMIKNQSIQDQKKHEIYRHNKT